jgi:hypothetical protein
VQQPGQAPIPETTPLRGQVTQAQAQITVGLLAIPVPETAAVHPDQPAGAPLGQAVCLNHVRNHTPPRCRLQNFPEAISFSAALSSIVSASNRFSFAFSASSVRSRLASDTSMPP